MAAQYYDEPWFKLFVGDLPADCVEEELQIVFSTYGKVEKVQLMPPKSRSGLRCALVFYETNEAAEDAIEVLHNKYKIREDAESPIQVRWSREFWYDWRAEGKGGDAGKGYKGDWSKGSKGGGGKDDGGKGGDAGEGGKAGKGADGGKGPEGPRLFIGSLPEDCVDEDLQVVFGTYGEVKHIHLMAPQANTGLRCAFVTYVDSRSAEDAITVLDGKYKIRENADSPIIVRWANDRKGAKGKEKGGKEKGSGKGKDKGYERGHPALPDWNDGKGGGYQKGSSSSSDWAGWRDESWTADQWDWERDRYDGGKGWGGSKGSGSKGTSWWDEPADWGKGGKKGGKGEAKGKKGDKGGKGDYKGEKGEKGEKGDYKGSKGGKDKDYKGGKGDDWARKGKDKDDGKGKDKDDGKGGKGKKGKEGKGKEPVHTVKVSNLPEDIEEDAIEYVFNTYGRVKRVAIPQQTPFHGSIFAYVDYPTANDAETAIASLHGKYEIKVGHGPLHVKIATTGNG